MHVNKSKKLQYQLLYLPDIYYRKWSQSHIKYGWDQRLVVNNLRLTFSSGNCYATFSTFSANFCFTNHRLPREGWLGVSRWIIINALVWFRRRWCLNALIYFLQSYISMSTTWFNEGKWIGHRRSQLRRHMYKRFPT